LIRLESVAEGFEPSPHIFPQLRGLLHPIEQMVTDWSRDPLSCVGKSLFGDPKVERALKIESVSARVTRNFIRCWWVEDPAQVLQDTMSAL
jgi:hypothetical protein